MRARIFILLVVTLAIACSTENSTTEETSIEDPQSAQLLSKYEAVRLTTNLSLLSENDKQVIPKLIEVGKVMDDLFWEVAYGDKVELLLGIDDPELRKFVTINYGPWDRLDNNAPFIEGVGEKPAGAAFYPPDMTKEEFEQADIEDKASLYTMIRRDEAGNLVSIKYSEAFTSRLEKAAQLLLEAADLTDNEEFKKYLTLRAEALLTDEYYESDIAWMDMTSNTLDIITGPIETYEDQLFGYKSAFTTYVLVKDISWSKRLEKYADLLPGLQRDLPVDAQYKAEEPGSKAQLNAYDVIYYAGDCNAGSKTIAVNLPNDEKIQLEKGTRRSQLKNAMRAKFDKILMPISKELITPDQRQYISFDAFFGNTMFHEVAHGLGIKNTINDKGTVRESLKEHASALEEGKADILGLYMVTKLHEQGEIDEPLMNHYVTFMASIFRSVRFGASSAHGKANMIRFNYFKEMGAFSRDAESGTYSIDFDKMQAAMASLSNLILTIQGNGDYEGAADLVETKAVINSELQADLDRLAELGIPVDIVFEQGVDVLGL